MTSVEQNLFLNVLIQKLAWLILHTIPTLCEHGYVVEEYNL